MGDNAQQIETLQQEVDILEKKYKKALEQKKSQKVIDSLKKKIMINEVKIEQLYRKYEKDIQNYVDFDNLDNLESNEAKDLLEKVKNTFKDTKVHSYFARKFFKTGVDGIKHKHQSQALKHGRKNNDSFWKIRQFEDERCFIPSNTNCYFKVLDFIFKDKPEIRQFLDNIQKEHEKPFRIGVSTTIQQRIEKQINEEYQKIYGSQQFLFVQQLHYSNLKKYQLNKYETILVRSQQHICLIIKKNRTYRLIDDFHKDVDYIEKKMNELKIDQSITQSDIDGLYSKKEIHDLEEFQTKYLQLKEKKQEKTKYDKKQTFFVADFESMQKDEQSEQEVYAAAFYTDVVHTDFLFQPKINKKKLFDKTPQQQLFYQNFTTLKKRLDQIEGDIRQFTIQSLKDPAFSLQIKTLLNERKQIIEQLSQNEDQFPSKNYLKEKREINQQSFFNQFERNLEEYCKQYDEENVTNLGKEIMDNQQQIQKIFVQKNQKKRSINYQEVVENYKQNFIQQIDFQIHKEYIDSIIIDSEEEEEEEEEFDLDLEEEKIKKLVEQKIEETKEQLLQEIQEKFGTEEEYYQKNGDPKDILKQILELEKEKTGLEEINEIHKQIVFQHCFEQVKKDNKGLIEQQYEEFYLGENGIDSQYDLINNFFEKMFSYTRNYPSYNKKSICYFHNGKNFDFYFMLKHIDFQKYEISNPQIDGQKVLSFTLSKKSVYNGKPQSTQIQFKCSTRLMSGSLKRISKDMKLSFRKIEIDSEVLLIKKIEQFEGETKDLIKEYLFFDVLSLGEALITFRNGMFSSQNKMECFDFQTISAVSVYVYKQFLKQYGIDLAELQFILPNIYQNIWLSEFVIGGRTNCYLNYFIKNSKKYKPFPLFYLDMNSLYPSAMKEICEKLGGYPHFNKNTKVLNNYEELIIKFNNYKYSENDIDFLQEAYLVECDVHQPLTKDFLFQNYQLFDSKGEKTEKVYKCNYPQESFIKQKFTNIDLFYAIKYNGATITKIHQCLFFPDRLNLKHDIFMSEMSKIRKQYQAENNDTCADIQKLIMNSGFGKLIQKPIFEKTHIVQDIKQYKEKHNVFIKDDYFEIGQENQKKFVIKTEMLELHPFAQNIADPVTGAFLLSYSKHLVNQMLIITNTYKFDENNLENFCYYSDTDSIIVGQKAYEKLNELGHVGKNLGQIKLEHFIQPGTFESYGKKIYRYENEFFEQDYRFKGLSFYNVSKTQNVTEEQIVNQCFDFMRKHSKQSMCLRFQQFVKNLSKQEIVVKINEKVIQATFQNEKLQKKIENIIFFQNRLQTVQQEIEEQIKEEEEEEEIEEEEENVQE